jgi:mono/diheme cytochrome c family protein
MLNPETFKMNTFMYSVKRNYRFKFSLTSILVLAFWAVISFAQAQDTLQNANAGSALGDATAGQALFEANCQSCHALTDEVVIGPGMKGILERRTIEWLIPWVKNSQKVIKSGDPYAVALFEKYNKAVMTSFEALSNDQIKSIFAYVSTYKPPVVTDNGKPGGEQQASASDSGSSNYFTLLLGILVVVLVLILSVLVLLMSVLNRFLQQREGELTDADKEIVNQKFNVFSIFQSRAFLGGITLIFLVIVFKSGLDGLVGVGMQQGYAPTQPIAFSHKLHAGQYEIDCGYCHTGVYKGKSATIPSANICMNCHNAIKRESPEIKKIYAALENDRPIEWVRVHNLPDLAYFNHAQHTNVAGLACEKCHGEIKEMEVVQQRAPLTMGWCINCHRQTVVEHAAKNPYYDRLLEYHAKHGKSQMTVENIGGLECSKCHY